MTHDRPQRTLRPLVFDEQHFCCEGAERFSAWVDTLISRLTKDGAREPTTQQLWEAKAKLLDEYRKERNGATRAHRDRLNDKAGDHCIYGVFLAALEHLAAIITQPTITPPARRKPVMQATEESKPRPRSVAEAMAEALKDVY
jgi:hypothetical protein